MLSASPTQNFALGPGWPGFKHSCIPKNFPARYEPKSLSRVHMKHLEHYSYEACIIIIIIIIIIVMLILPLLLLLLLTSHNSARPQKSVKRKRKTREIVFFLPFIRGAFRTLLVYSDYNYT